MKLDQWPQAERPRERLLSSGAGALSDAELIALFLGQGLPGCNAVELARRWLQELGDLESLLNADAKTFCSLPGAGKARYVLFQAAIELGKRRAREQIKLSPVISSPSAVVNYLYSQFAGAQREHFGCLFLDAQHHVIDWKILFSGTLNSAAVYPREVVSAALSCGAAAVLLAHNHPSGVAEPSEADRRITERLSRALELVDIKVLDHLVIGSGVSVSFAERGWL